MGSKTKLMRRLDESAEKLLDVMFDGPDMTPQQLEMHGARVKTFDSVVKYYGPRTKLGTDEEKQSEFERLRDGLTTTGRKAARRTSAEVEAYYNGASTAANDDPSGEPN